MPKYFKSDDFMSPPCAVHEHTLGKNTTSHKSPCQDFVAQHNAEYSAIVKARSPSAAVRRCIEVICTAQAGGFDTRLRRTQPPSPARSSSAVNAIHNYSKMRCDSRYELGYRKSYGFMGFLEKGVGFLWTVQSLLNGLQSKSLNTVLGLLKADVMSLQAMCHFDRR